MGMTNMHVITGQQDDIMLSSYTYTQVTLTRSLILLLLVISMHFDRDSVKLPYCYI